MAKQYLLTLLGAAPFFVVWTLLDMWRLRARRRRSCVWARDEARKGRVVTGLL